MSDKTGIEWTATVHPDGSVTPGSTWNPTTGCSKVSPGCAHCYAENVALRFWPTQYPRIPLKLEEQPVLDSVMGPVRVVSRPRQFTDVMCHDDRLDQPLRWKRPRRIFVNSMSDLFHDDVPDAFIDKVFAVMALAPQHTFQVLTKRAERMRAYLSRSDLWPRMSIAMNRPADGSMPSIEKPNLITLARAIRHEPRRHVLPLPNVWLGVSVESQRFADERIPLLLQTPAAVRFISAEPLLGPVDLTNLDPDGTYARMNAHGFSAIWKSNAIRRPWLDWVIVGGESGKGARPFDVAWARSIVQQCQSAGVPVFVKQLGASPEQGLENAPLRMMGLGLRDKKGGDPSEWPEDLRVRQFPTQVEQQLKRKKG